MVEQRHRMQRIDIRDQMATHAISIDQFHHARLTDGLLMHLIGAHEEWIAIDVPAQRRVRNAEIGKNLFVEFVLAQEQFMDTREKRTRFGALDDAMVVSAADIYRFADSKLRKNGRRHR